MAQAERMLERAGAASLGVHDENAFLFGCLVPDIYVGYMVPGLSVSMPYRVTHLAVPEEIPLPDADRFRVQYIEGGHAEGDSGDGGCASALVRDMALGAWAHLAADHLWNSRVRAFAAEHGLVPGEELRIRKQRDFDVFGRTLPIGIRLELTSGLAAAASRFPQYAIDEVAVVRTVEVANGIAEGNHLREGEEPRYVLLGEKFFTGTFELSVEAAVGMLRDRAR